MGIISCRIRHTRARPTINHKSKSNRFQLLQNASWRYQAHLRSSTRVDNVMVCPQPCSGVQDKFGPYSLWIYPQALSSTKSCTGPNLAPEGCPGHVILPDVTKHLAKHTEHPRATHRTSVSIYSSSHIWVSWDLFITIGPPSRRRDGIYS